MSFYIVVNVLSTARASCLNHTRSGMGLWVQGTGTFGHSSVLSGRKWMEYEPYWALGLYVYTEARGTEPEIFNRSDLYRGRVTTKISPKICANSPTNAFLGYFPHRNWPRSSEWLREMGHVSTLPMSSPLRVLHGGSMAEWPLRRLWATYIWDHISHG